MSLRYLTLAVGLLNSRALALPAANKITCDDCPDGCLQAVLGAGATCNSQSNKTKCQVDLGIWCPTALTGFQQAATHEKKSNAASDQGTDITTTRIPAINAHCEECVQKENALITSLTAAAKAHDDAKTAHGKYWAQKAVWELEVVCSSPTTYTVHPFVRPASPRPLAPAFRSSKRSSCWSQGTRRTLRSWSSRASSVLLSPLDLTTHLSTTRCALPQLARASRTVPCPQSSLLRAAGHFAFGRQHVGD